MTLNIMVLQPQNKLLIPTQILKKIKTWTIINGEKSFSTNKNLENLAVMEVKKIKHLLITKDIMLSQNKMMENNTKSISSINIKKTKNLKSLLFKFLNFKNLITRTF